MLFDEFILFKLKSIVKEAGKSIIDIYNKDYIDIKLKDDLSPVTKADKLSNKIILEGLRELDSSIPIISEESELAPYSVRSSWEYCWLVDPLDGTKEFISKTDDFTINIALIKNNKPVFGLVYIPVTADLYWASLIDNDSKAYWQNLLDSNEKQEIHTKYEKNNLRIAVSKRHGCEDSLKKFLKNKKYKLVYRGSTLKICLIAKGEADLYPRFGPTSEWDTAAGHCILRAVGGEILSWPELKPLEYNNKDSIINPEFIATSAHVDLKTFNCG